MGSSGSATLLLIAQEAPCDLRVGVVRRKLEEFLQVDTAFISAARVEQRHSEQVVGPRQIGIPVSLSICLAAFWERSCP